MNDRPPQIDTLAPLSKRERMIAERFAEGLTHRQIGEELFIAPSTVRTHIAAIYRKLEIGNKAGLVTLIVRQGEADTLSRATRDTASEERDPTSDAELTDATQRESPPAGMLQFGVGWLRGLTPDAAKAAGGPRNRQSHWHWSAAAAIGVVVATTGATGSWIGLWEQLLQSEETPALPDKPSIAVLPFDNVSADPEEEYFVDGLTDDLITDLSNVSGLFVIARNSTFSYKDQAVDVRDVAGQLGVRYVLEGSARRAGGRVRINAQLIDGSTGRHVWASRYDRGYAEIHTVQDEVITRIVDALEVELTETEKTQVARLPTDSLEAYDYYLRAEEFIYRSDPAAATGALEFYDKAIALDPEFAEAHAGYARVAADVLAYDYPDALPAAVARKRAYEAAGQALVLEPHLARGYSVLALLQLLDSEHQLAVASARTATNFGPNSAEAHLNLAVVLTYAGQHDEARRTMDIVLRLNPKPPRHVHDYQSLILYMNRRYAEAVAVLKGGKAAASTDLALEMLAAANARLGRAEEAKAAIGRLLERWPDQSVARYRVMYAHHARQEDRLHRLEGLRLAGLPEWPYGFEGDADDRLSGAAIEAVTFGRTWVGEFASVGIGPFMLYTDSSGNFVQRGTNHQLSGTASRHGDELCLQMPSLFLGRRNCGPMFRTSEGTPGNQDQYSFVNAGGIRQFTIQP